MAIRGLSLFWQWLVIILPKYGPVQTNPSKQFSTIDIYVVANGKKGCVKLGFVWLILFIKYNLCELSNKGLSSKPLNEVRNFFHWVLGAFNAKLCI